MPTFLARYIVTNAMGAEVSVTLAMWGLLLKKVVMNRSPRLTSVVGSYHVIYLTNTLLNYVIRMEQNIWPREVYRLVEVVLNE